MRKNDLIGKRFGRLTVIERLETQKKPAFKMKGKKKIKYYRYRSVYLCQCDCGNTKAISRRSLLFGNSNSCGCYNVEIVTERLPRLYCSVIWNHMIKKCENKDDRFYHLYGGRGITVCEEWHDLDTFYNWIKENTPLEQYRVELKKGENQFNPNTVEILPPMIEKKKERYGQIKKCPVTKEEFEFYVRSSAAFVLPYEEAYDYFKVNEPLEPITSYDACKKVGLSEDLFKKRARQFLMPEVYGELPKQFFDDEELRQHEKLAGKVKKASDLPTLKEE